MLVLHGEHAAPAGIDLIQKLGEFPQRLGAEYQIHMAIGLAYLLRHLGALCHAAAQADDLLRVGLFRVGQGAQIAVDPLFRVVTDGAGVQYDDIGLGRLGDEVAAHGLQHAHDMLAVRHILLAAEGIHQCADAPAPLGVQLSYFPFEIPLTERLLLRDQYLFSVQVGPPCPDVDTGRYLNTILYHAAMRNTRKPRNKSCKPRANGI